MVLLEWPHGSRQLDRGNATLIPPVGSGSWVIELEQGGRVQFDNDELGQAVAGAFGHGRIVAMLERSWPWALAMAVVAALGIWATLTWGVPAAARHVAFAVPPELEAKLGDESMSGLDRLFFDESELPDEQRARVERLFSQVQDASPNYSTYRLLFRKSDGIGANAFAVPGGIVVITDEMVELAADDDELISVLAHEIGHLAQRHSLRILLQNSASAVIIASLTGDITNVTAVAATIPTVLMQAKYSRDFEREADDFAFSYMQAQGLDTDALSRLLLRLEESEGLDSHDDAVSDWLSSHPRSEERVPER